MDTAAYHYMTSWRHKPATCPISLSSTCHLRLNLEALCQWALGIYQASSNSNTCLSAQLSLSHTGVLQTPFTHSLFFKAQNHAHPRRQCYNLPENRAGANFSTEKSMTDLNTWQAMRPNMLICTWSSPILGPAFHDLVPTTHRKTTKPHGGIPH